MTKEELIALSDLNREDNIKYISSEAQGIAIALDSDRYAPTLCKLERAYICGRRKSEKQIAELKTQIEKMKWHKVADGDLPKNRRRVYVAYLNGEYFHQETIASYRHKYWVIDGHKTECEIIAWCELPKWEMKK